MKNRSELKELRENIIKYASKDPDIRLNHFEKYLDRYVGPSQRNSPKEEKEDSAKISDPYHLSSKFSHRGAIARPGFGSTLQNDKLKNQPSEWKEYEVFINDAIPLEVYKKMALDPKIVQGLLLIKGWIGGLKYNVQCADPEMKIVVEYALGKIWTGLIRDLLDAFIFGFQFCEKVWQREDLELEDILKQDGESVVFKGKAVTYKKIKALDPDQNFRFYKDTNDEISKVVQRQRLKDVTVKRDKLVWFALDKRHSGIFGTSRLKSVYEIWYYAKINYQYLLLDNEKRGSPHLEIRYPPGNTVIDGEVVSNDMVAVSIAEGLRAHNVALIPSDETDKGNPKWDIKYADNKQNGNDSPHLKFIEFSDKKKLQAIGIPESVLSSDSGFQGIDAGGDLLVVIIEDIVNQLEDVIQKDVVDPLVEHNWGPRYCSKVKVKIDKSGLGRRRVFKEVLINMMRIAASIPGHKPKAMPDIADICKEMGIPVSLFDSIFDEAEFSSDAKGESLLKEIQRNEDGNDINRDRLNPTERERDYLVRDATDTD